MSTSSTNQDLNLTKIVIWLELKCGLWFVIWRKDLNLSVLRSVIWHWDQWQLMTCAVIRTRTDVLPRCWELRRLVVTVVIVSIVGESSWQTKVTDLHVNWIVVCYEDVTCCQVTMNNLLGRQVHHSLTSAAVSASSSAAASLKLGDADVSPSPVGGMAQWQERRSWLPNIPCHTLDLQLMGDHLCG